MQLNIRQWRAIFTSRFAQAPVIGTAPVLDQVAPGVLITFTPAGNVSGTPTPTLRHDLYVNGALSVTGITTGTVLSGPSSDQIQIIPVAANNQGTATTPASNIVTVGVPIFTQQAAPGGVVSRAYVSNDTQESGWEAAPYQYPFKATCDPTYSLASGTLPVGSALDTTTGLVKGFLTVAGTYTYAVAATNAAGTTVSATQTVVVTYLPEIVGQPATGVPATFVIPGYYDPLNGLNGTITSVQWRRNNGTTGPQNIGGATSLTYSPTDPTDTGSWLSIQVVTPIGTFTSTEFPALGAILSQTPVLTHPTPSLGLLFVTDIGHGFTFASPTLVRAIGNNSVTASITGNVLDVTAIGSGIVAAGQTLGGGATGFAATTIQKQLTGVPGGIGHYQINTSQTVGSTTIALSGVSLMVDTLFAAGTYSGFAQFGQLGGNAFGTFFRAYQIKSAPPVIKTLTAPAATATRPAGNTGAGFFVKGSALYDPNGNFFRMRGINKLHADGGSPGLLNSKANVVRYWLDLKNPWATYNKPWLDSLIAAKMVPMVTMSGAYIPFLATFDGAGNMTVTSLLDRGIGYLFIGMRLSPSGGSGNSTLTVTGQTSGTTGKAGVYTLSATGTANATPAQFGGFYGSTGSALTALLDSMARTWVDLYSDLSSYDGKMILNIANEFGDVASASNTEWRDAYATASTGAIAKIRTGGYLCPFTVDACSNGQDTITGQGVPTTYGLLNHSKAILTSDPQANTFFALHTYGKWPFAGQLSATFTALSTLSADPTLGGMAFCIGEFGPGRNVDVGAAGGGPRPQDVMYGAEANQFAGWLGWAWDDHVHTPPGQLEDDFWYAFNYLYTTGFSTSNLADCTFFGRTVVGDAQCGTLTATPATIF